MGHPKDYNSTFWVRDAGFFCTDVLPVTETTVQSTEGITAAQ